MLNTPKKKNLVLSRPVKEDEDGEKLKFA